jgi:hypothetical protein
VDVVPPREMRGSVKADKDKRTNEQLTSRIAPKTPPSSSQSLCSDIPSLAQQKLDTRNQTSPPLSSPQTPNHTSGAVIYTLQNLSVIDVGEWEKGVRGTVSAMDRIAEQIKRGLVVDGLDSIVASGGVGDGLWWARRGQDGIDE